jgi:hypothetical protein
VLLAGSLASTRCVPCAALCSSLSACVHADIVEIKHILLPEGEKRFKDIFVVFELMETDLHQVCFGPDRMRIARLFQHAVFLPR